MDSPKSENDKKVILVIDHVATELSLLSIVLESRFEVKLEKCAAKALRLLEQQPVDLILVAIEMPGMSGFEFLNRIRRKPQLVSIPVIALSSRQEPNIACYALKNGAARCLAKPVTAGVLLQKIDELLGFTENPGAEPVRENVQRAFPLP